MNGSSTARATAATISRVSDELGTHTPFDRFGQADQDIVGLATHDVAYAGECRIGRRLKERHGRLQSIGHVDVAVKRRAPDSKMTCTGASDRWQHTGRGRRSFG